MKQVRTDWPLAEASVYEEIDSTNLEILRRSEKGAPEGTLVVAEEQLAGRGRRGRGWESPKGVSIYMSVLLRPALPMDRAHILTPISAYAIWEVLKELGFDVQIKWPNDVVIHGKKVCGILNEMQIGPDGTYSVVTGMGININNRDFGDVAGGIGTSLYLETGRIYEREPIIEDVIRAYRRYYDAVNAAGSLEPIKDSYNDALVNKDRPVRILDPKGEWTGTARGINELGELLVETEDGTVIPVSAGEVSVRGVYGYTE